MIPVTRLARFAVVGLLSTGAYFAAVGLIRQYLNLSVTASGTAAFALVVALNYLSHYFWTFQSNQRHTIAAPRFVTMALGGLALNSLGVAVGTHLFRLPQLTALVLGAALVISWNLFVSTFWVFAINSSRQP